MGLTLGPVINAYVQSFGNGSQIVMTAMGGTGIIFLALSAYVVVTQKDFSFIGGHVDGGDSGCVYCWLGCIYFPNADAEPGSFSHVYHADEWFDLVLKPVKSSMAAKLTT